MALKDIWKDLQNAIEGVPNSGDDISADDINNIAHAVIDLENDDGDESLATKEYVDSAIGDVETSLENIIAKYGLGGDDV